MESTTDWSGADFRKPTRSTTQGTNSCVEVAFKGKVVGVQDSKNRTGIDVIEFGRNTFQAFLNALPEWPAAS